MNSKLKEKVLSHLQEVNDDFLMHEIARLIQLESDDIIEEFLSLEEKERLQLSLKQVTEKKTITSQQANKEIDEWLGK